MPKPKREQQAKIKRIPQGLQSDDLENINLNEFEMHVPRRRMKKQKDHSGKKQFEVERPMIIVYDQSKAELNIIEKYEKQEEDQNQVELNKNIQEEEQHQVELNINIFDKELNIQNVEPKEELQGGRKDYERYILQKQIEDPNFKNSEGINQQNQTPVKSNQRLKKIIFISLILIIIVIAVGIAYSFLERNSPTHQPQFKQQKGPQNYIQEQQEHNLILKRNLKKNQCYIVNYTLVTSIRVEQNVTCLIRSNETLYFCIGNVTQNGNLLIIGLQKRVSEENMDKQPIEITTFETEPGIESALFRQISADTQNGLVDEQKDFFELDEEENGTDVAFNETTKQELSESVIMFYFTVFHNGTLDRIAFNSKNDNRTIATLPKMIKLFFPKLDISLYNPSRRLQETQANNNNTTTNDSNSSQNSEPVNTPQAQENHSAQQSQAGTTLSSTLTEPVDPNADLHASHEISSQANFDSNGDLVGSQMNGQSQIISQQLPSSDSHQVVNVPQKVIILHNISAYLVRKMTNLTTQNIDAFASFFQYNVIEKNLSLNYTQAELKEYLTDQGGQKQSTSRLLASSTTNLFNQNQDFKLLSTNVLGIPMVVHGKAGINIGLIKMSQYKYRPSFIAQSLLLLVLGPFKKTYTIFGFKKQFDPISFGFTLDKVKSLITLYKADFIGMIDKIQKFASFINFNKNFGANLRPMLGKIKQLRSELDFNQLKLIPLGFMKDFAGNFTQIFNRFSQIQKTILNKVNTIKEAQQEIFKFSNLTYFQNLLKFRNFKSQLQLNKKLGTEHLIKLQNQIVSTIDKHSSAIAHKINNEFEELYQQQLKKAKGFFDFCRFVQSKTVLLHNNLLEAVQIHRSRFQKNLIAFLDYFYESNSIYFNAILANVTSKVKLIDDEYFSLSKSVQDSKIAAQRFVQNFINQIQSMKALNDSNSTIVEAFKTMFNELRVEAVAVRPQPCFKYFSSFALTYQLQCGNGKNGFRLAEGYFNQVQKSLMPVFVSQANSWSGIVQRLIQQQNSNRSLMDKMMSIKALLSGSVGYSLDIIKLRQNLTSIQSIILQYKKDLSCCHYPSQAETISIYIDKMIVIIGAFLNRSEAFFNQQKFQQYLKKAQAFNQDKYQQLLKNSQLPFGIIAPVTQQKTNLKQVETIINQIQVVKKNSVSGYLLGQRIYPLIQGSFKAAIEGIQKYCDYQANNSNPDSVKKLYQNSARFLIASINGNIFFSDAFSKLLQSYNNGSKTAFDSFSKTKFCNQKVTQSINFINSAIDDSVNFEVIEQIILRTQITEQQTKIKINETKDTIRFLQRDIKRLRNKEMFNALIERQSLLAETIKDITNEYCVNMSLAKVSLEKLDNFTFSNIQNILVVFREFSQAKSALNYFEMFQQQADMKAKAYAALANLNFQVFFVAALLGQQKQLLQSFLSQSKNQLQGLTTSLGSLTNRFQTLTQQVTSDQLFMASQNYNSLMDAMTSKIMNPIKSQIQVFNTQYINITSKIKQYSSLKLREQKVELMKFYALKDERLFEIITFCTLQFDESNIKSFNWIYQQQKHFQTFLSKNIETIKSIKIGLLNTINQMGKVAYPIYDIFKNGYLKDLDGISKLMKRNYQDFYSVFGVSQYILKTQKSIDKGQTQALSSIQGKINSYLTLLQRDSDFYSSFTNTIAYSKISSLKKSMAIDNNVIWGMVKSNIDAVKNMELNISPDKIQLFRKISSTVHNFTALYKKLEEKLTKLISTFSNMNSFFSQIKRLIFGSLQKQMSSIMKDNMNLSQSLINKMRIQDMDDLEQLCQLDFPPQLASIKNMLSDINQMKNTFISGTLTVLTSNFKEDIQKVILFLKQQIIQKMDTLVQSNSVLSSITSSQNPLSRANLYRNVFLEKRVMFFEITFAFPTPIGVFLFTFAIDLRLGGNIFIDLVNLRSVEIGVGLKSSLNLYAYFGYGIPRILEVGTFIRGQLMALTVTPGFQLDKIIPLQLIPGLNKIAEFNQENSFGLNFFTDIEIHALAFEFGGYIKHIWIKIRWIKIRFCIRIRKRWFRFRFCLRIRLPLIWFTMKTHYFSHRTNGISLLNKRVLSLQIFKFNY